MPNLVYENEESAITWLSTGGTEQFLASGAPIASAAGRQGALHDFGVAARSRRFVWRAWIKPGTTRVVGERVELYLKTSDGSHPDNDDGTGDIAVSSSDKLRNLKPIGVIQIDENAAVEMANSGEIEISARHAGPVFWNATANSLSSTATDYGFSLTPVPDEIQ
jgi:hypothetical protein